MQAIIAAGGRPRVIVEASTFAIEDKLRAERALRRAGHVMLDCPVSGTGAQAKVKDLVVYASGERAALSIGTKRSGRSADGPAITPHASSG